MNSNANVAPQWPAIWKTAKRRLIWKEGKLLLPACLGLLGLVVIGMIANGVFPNRVMDDNTRWFVILVLGSACMAGLICGSTIFSLERENRTDTFLRRLPVDAAKLAWTKILTAVFFFAVTFLVTTAIAVALFALFYQQNLAVASIRKTVLGPIWPVALIVPCLCFLWSLALSRYLNSTLFVVAWSVVGVFSGTFLAMIAWQLIVSYLYGDHPNHLYVWQFVVIHGGQALGLIYAIVRHPGNWLRPSAAAARSAAVANDQLSFQPQCPAGPMRSLLWQTLRLKSKGLCCAAVACVGFVVTMLLVINSSYVLLLRHELPLLGIEVSNDLFASVMGALSGIMLFYHDQRGKAFLFFQQRGNYSRRIWLSRMVYLLIVGLLVSLAIALVNQVSYMAGMTATNSFFIDPGSINSDWHSHRMANEYVPIGGELEYFLFLTYRSLTCFFVVAAVGQLVSIFCRSEIAVGVLGIVIAGVTTMWMRQVNWFLVPTWCWGWPIAVGGFFISWWYAPAWIRGTRQFRWAGVATVLMCLIAAGCVTGFVFDRLNDYQPVPGWSHLDELYHDSIKLKENGDPRFESARQIEKSLATIDAAWTELDSESSPVVRVESDRVFSEQELAIVDTHRSEFETMVKQLARPDSRRFYNVGPGAAPQVRESKAVRLRLFLHLYAAKVKQEDSSQAIIDLLLTQLFHSRSRTWYYVDLFQWCDSPDRRPAELLAAIEKMDRGLERWFSSDNEIWLEGAYANLQTVLERERDKSWLARSLGSVEHIRLKNKLSQQLLIRWRNIQARRRISLGLPGRWQQPESPDVELAAPGRGDSASLNANFFHNDNSFFSLQYAQVRLALAAWKLQHGQYPATLSDLSDDGIVDPDHRMVSIFNSLEYQRQGLDQAVARTASWISNGDLSGTYTYSTDPDDVIPANTPFLLPWRSALVETRRFSFADDPKQRDADDSTIGVKPTFPAYLIGGGLEMSRWRQQLLGVQSYILGEKPESTTDDSSSQ